MSARAMRAVDFPLLFGPTKTLMCASNSNVISSKGPTLVTRKSRIGIDKSPEMAPPQHHNLFILPLSTDIYRGREYHRRKNCQRICCATPSGALSGSHASTHDNYIFSK